MPPQEDRKAQYSGAIAVEVGGADDGVVNTNLIMNGSEEGYHLRWSRISKSVEVKEGTSGLLRSSIAAPTVESAKKFQKMGGPITKTILKEVSGFAAPGKVLALMGPSGSGKTSLLNILSGRSTYNSGVISINGDPISGPKMKRLMSKIAYVRQQDVFFEHLTLRDQLTYTALLRLPSSLSKSEMVDEVEATIRELRLTKVAQSPIMMLSGGEKKRTNIGSELLTKPKLLLLDEPTSGLDSTSAVALIHLLADLAKNQHKTVITSIHQPSSAIFRSFDNLLLLAEGNMIYFGTPTGSLSYLAEKGYGCPEGYNAADHWMDLLVVDTVLDDPNNDEEFEEELTDAFGDGSKVMTDMGKSTTLRHRARGGRMARRDSTVPVRIQLIKAWDREALAEQMDAPLKGDADTVRSHDNLDQVKKYNTSWLTQFGVLTHRSMKNSRSAIFTPLNFVKSLALGIIAGLLWWQTPNTEKSVVDRSSYYFFTMTYWVFDAMFTALMAFPSEREVVLKERSSGAYRLSAYFIAKTVSEAPARLMLPFLYMVPSFWMAGVNPRFAVFVGSTLCTLLSCLAGEAIGLFIGAWIYDLEKAMTVMTVFALFLMLLGGFFVQNVPFFLTWGMFISPFKYAFDASRQLVFDRSVPCDGSGVLEDICGGRDTGFATPEEVKNFLAIQGTVAFNVGCLLVICFLPRFGAYVALRSKKEGDRA